MISWLIIVFFGAVGILLTYVFIVLWNDQGWVFTALLYTDMVYIISVCSEWHTSTSYLYYEYIVVLSLPSLSPFLILILIQHHHHHHHNHHHHPAYIHITYIHAYKPVLWLQTVGKSPSTCSTTYTNYHNNMPLHN